MLISPTFSYQQTLLYILLWIFNIKNIEGDYNGYTLYNIVPTTNEQLKFLRKVERQGSLWAIFWKKSQKLYESAQILVNIEDKESFLEKVYDYGFDVEELIRDVQKEFDKQSVNNFMRHQNESYTWERYHNWDEINKWITDLPKKFPNITEVKKIGQTVEGRDILALSIKKENASKGIVIEGGIHGNEWVAIEFCTYLINSLLEPNTENDKTLGVIAAKISWYIIPILNPDGFYYTHKTDRLWNKNRNNYVSGTGVDLNRNFDSNFCKFDSSAIPYHDNFCGPSPNSELETKALATFVESRHNLTGYISIRSYGQKIILPFGDRKRHLGNYFVMENYAKQAVVRMYEHSKNKHKYAFGTNFDVSGIRVSGESASWVKKNFKVPYVFTFYLGDNGTFGHALPPDLIQPTCKESLLGLTELLTAKPKYLREDIYLENRTAVGHYFSTILFIVLSFLL